MKISEVINPTGRQKECLKALRSFRFVLYGGAMGGGKSYLLRWWCVLQAIYYFTRYGVRNVRIGLFSEDYPTLVDRQISKIKFEFPAWVGRISESRTEGFNFKLCDALGGGTIAFRNLDDPSKYNSAEFASIAVEELTKNKEFVFHELRKRMRWPGIPDEDTRFLGATNPGGPGHAWVKRFWMDRDLPAEMASISTQFAYVQSKAQDNPHLSEGYYASLLTLPTEMAKAYAEGDWDLFAGQYFTEWRKDVHVCDPFEIPWYWKIERCGDWGEAKPCAYLWVATNPEGFKYVIGEVYGEGMRIQEQAERILEFERGKKVVRTGVLDSACWDVTGRAQSIADQFLIHGIRWAASAKGPGSRVAGWNAIRKLLHFERDATGNIIKQPKLKVFSNCMNLIRTLPTLEHDEHKPEDVDSDGEDHACFVAGTMIATPGGDHPIEGIRRGDFVLSPLGIARVLEAGYTGKREVFRRIGVTATPNHPFFCQQGLRRFDSLRDEDSVWKLNGSYSMGSGLHDSLKNTGAYTAANVLRRSGVAALSFAAMRAKRPIGWLAAWMMSPAFARRAVRAFALTDIGLQKVAVGNAGPHSTENVYNLKTDHGCYFANGILVSNCDALRYHIVGPSSAPQTPESEENPDDAALLRQADKRFMEAIQA